MAARSPPAWNGAIAGAGRGSPGAPSMATGLASGQSTMGVANHFFAKGVNTRDVVPPAVTKLPGACT